MFDWGSADMSAFDVAVLEAALPNLASTPDLSWNVSQFTLDGTVSVSTVPEPSASVLFAIGVAGLIGTRMYNRRK